MRETMQLKAKVKNVAKDKNIPAQSVLQSYMMERFLERLTFSGYKDDFILKGGLLVSAIIGIEKRFTMDIDANFKHRVLNDKTICKFIDDVIKIDLDDNVNFALRSIDYIRETSECKGYRVHVESKCGGIIAPLKLDISSGDIITPHEEIRKLGKVLTDEHIEVMAYNVETLLAEKYETVIRRGVQNTRMRDFYDIYILTQIHFGLVNFNTFVQALIKTCKNRQTIKIVPNTLQAINVIKSVAKSPTIKRLWEHYQKCYSYARGIEFDAVMKRILHIAKYVQKSY